MFTEQPYEVEMVLTEPLSSLFINSSNIMIPNLIQK